MSVLAAVVCPHPPLLVPEVAAGAAAELDDLRNACDAALAAALATAPDLVVVVGAADRTGPAAARAVPTWAGFGLPGPTAEEPLPLALAIGSWLLDRAGWAGPRVLHGVSADEGAATCAELGARLGAGPRTLLLVLGDGSARRSAAAPGHLDARAEAFDAAVLAAFAAGDAAALRGLDVRLAGDLLAAGRPAWQVLAGAVPAGGVVAARVFYADAPFGVGYFVATWLLAPTPPGAHPGPDAPTPG